MSLPHAIAPLPLSDTQTEAVARLTAELDAAGLWWLSGYAAGLASRAPLSLALAGAADAATAVAIASHNVAPHGDAPAVERLTIIYGSQTGNARRVAEALAADAEASGLATRLLRADAYATRELKRERYLCLVVSTQGDGDPSDDACELHDFLIGPRAPRLDQLKFAVLGLGDSSYAQFCAIGARLDARLAELGAQRLTARGDADLDIDTVAMPWRQQALAAAKDALKPLATVTPLRRPANTAPSITRDAPFAAEVLVNQRITAAPQGKDVRHLELSLENSGLRYEPGDALGVWPRNPEALVDEVIRTLRLDPGEQVAHADATHALRDWLLEHRELTRLSRPFLAAQAERGGVPALRDMLATNGTALRDWLDTRQVIDLLQRHPAVWSARELVAALRPLTPRLYSIASSQQAVGDEAHLTVAHVEYRRDDASRWGAASHLLATRAPGDTVRVYVERNERFRLPADGGRDLIMIGPGTGVAPFRGFVQERIAAGATGRHWLLFGNPHFRSDFLYQLEWQRALKSGQLHRLDLAFSRDQAEKRYVQHRLREHAHRLYAWLQGGAHLYVCGSVAMGKDVHAALLDVVAAQGGLDAAGAADYLQALQRQGRYARDVY